MHFVHLCIRVAQIRKIPDSDLGWEDMYREDEGEDWFDWVRLLFASRFIFSRAQTSGSTDTRDRPSQ